jgi:hypothetical protein
VRNRRGRRLRSAGRPSGQWGCSEMDDSSAMASEFDENEERAQAGSGTMKKSRGTRSRHRGTVSGSRSEGAVSTLTTLWPARSRRTDPSGGVGAVSPCACRRRADGARPRSRGELTMAANEEGRELKQVEQHGNHRAEIFSVIEPTAQASGCRRSIGEGQAPVPHCCPRATARYGPPEVCLPRRSAESQCDRRTERPDPAGHCSCTG